RFLAAVDDALARPKKHVTLPELRVSPHEASRDNSEYRAQVRHLQDLVHNELPQGATVIVASKGDEALVTFDGRDGWHFPRSADAAYAGYYPAKSDEAIEHLEQLRAAGGEFLLFPKFARWWLEYYRGFREHLESHYTVVIDDDACAIFSLTVRETEPAVVTEADVEHGP